MDLLWLVQDFDSNSNNVFTELHLALHAAERIVGNRAVSVSPGMGANNTPGYLYGPGDGTTRVMVRAFTRDMLLMMDIPVLPAE